MFRQRLKGGHRVGATSSFHQQSQGHSGLAQQPAGWGMPQQQPPIPMQPGQPPPQQPPPPTLQHQQHQQQTNSYGWGNNDNSWDWGETDNTSSNTSNQVINSHQLNQHQLPLNPHQQQNYGQHALNQHHHAQQQHPPHAQQQHPPPPVPQYNHQPQAYPQQLQHTSQSQQQFAKEAPNTVQSNNQHVSNTSSVYSTSQPQQFSANSQAQFVNGNSQNGNGEWENDWGSDWSQAEAYNNNVYGKQEQHYGQQQQYQAQLQHYQTQQEQYHLQQQHDQAHQNYQREANEKNAEQQQQQNIHHTHHQYQGDIQNTYQHQQQHYGQENKSIQPQQHQQQHQQQESTQVVQQHQTLEQQQQYQGQSEAPQASQADEWGWGNDDWDTSKQEKEQSLTSHDHQQQQQFLAHQTESAIPSDVGATDSMQDQQRETEVFHGKDPSQTTAGRDVAGDGWLEQGSEALHPSQAQYGSEQHLQSTEQPAASENDRESMPPSHHLEGQQQESYHYDDGHVQEAEVDFVAVTTSGVTTSHHSTVVDSGQFLATSGSDPSHTRQDSWGWGSSHMEIQPETIGASAPSKETSATPEAGDSSAPQPYNVEEQTVGSDQASSTNERSMYYAHEEPQNNDIPVTESAVQESNSAASGAVVTDTWDDDGWGDGWEADTPAVQEGGPPEANTQENVSLDQQQHHDLYQQLADVNRGNQPPNVHSEKLDVGVAEPIPPAASMNSELQKSVSPAAVVSEPHLYGHQPQTETHQDVCAWESSWNQNVTVDSSVRDAPSNEALESITQDMGTLSLNQSEKEVSPSPVASTTYSQHSYTESGVNYSQASQLHPQYHYSNYPTQSETYHQSSQGDTQPSSNWQSNQSAPVQEAESHQNRQWFQPQGFANPIPESQPQGDQTRMTQSPYPPPVPISHREGEHYSHPAPVPSPQPPAPEAVPPETLHYPVQDPALPSHHQHSQHLPSQPETYHQYQGLNQEIIEESEASLPRVPDPMISRIPDGASSVSEIPAGAPAVVEPLTQVTEEPMNELRSSFSEMSDRPSSTQSAQSITSQPTLLPSQPVRPPSAHSHPERPASNQSAHSVHSVRSAQSVHSAYSNRSTQSSHSILGQNQEMPPNEGVKVLPNSGTYQAPHPYQNTGTAACNVPNANSRPTPPPSVPDVPESTSDSGIDPTAPPSNNPIGPPPAGGPLGSVTNFRARKGSPFQPPLAKHPQTAPAPLGIQSQPPSVARPILPNYADDVSANLEMPPDNNEQPTSTEGNAVPLWTSSENLTSNVKLAVAAPSIEGATPVQHPSGVDLSISDGANVPSSAPPSNIPSIPNNPIPLVVPGMIKEEYNAEPPSVSPNPPQVTRGQPDPPVAHNTHSQPPAAVTMMQTHASAPPPSSTPGALDLSRSSRTMNEPRGDGSQSKTETPNFSRMVPGESSKGESASTSTYQAPSVVPSMPSERVVTGNDNPQPVLPVRIKQEPAEVRSPPDGPYTSDLSGQGASVVPPVRSETIGSEEPASRNFASTNSGSRPDLANDHRSERVGRWERDHSRDRDSRSGDRYHDRSRDRSRDYYRDDSPHSRRSYDRDYDYKYDSDRRMWRHDSEDDEDNDRRYYESRDRRDRAYRDELDRYSDRPIKEEKDRGSRRESSRDKRRDYRDRSRDYRSYDDDPYFGRSDRSQPVSRSSSINNLDNEGDRSGHSHRSRHDYYDRHDRRDSRSRDSDHRDRDGPYSRSNRDRDSSYSRDSRDPRRDPRYYGQRGYEDAYSSRELYDQYQYYYQYYRDHPYYKEYYRQWMKQYGQAYPSHESFYDDRTSIHSGRSSVNDELKKSISSQFMQDFHGRSSVSAYEPSAIYPDGSFSQLKSYASGELSGVPSVGGDSASEAPQRLTPVQHGRPHINARFTPGGQLVMVLPKDPRDGEKAVVQLRDMQKMLSIDPALSRCIEQMKGYPGPLTLADTHKDVVVRYCEQQAAEAAKDQALPDRESVTLIWEYLALLVKQNGKLYGSDVAGLLLKGQDKTSPTQPSASHPSAEDAVEVSSSDGSPQDEGIDVQSQSSLLPPPRDEAALLKKFTEYLCLGRKKEAVDYAMREGLWGHALALSYKMDSTTHTRVLAAFSNSIPHNDVLLTLFQQLSGKKPEVTKNYTPHQWGNWRKHLAMMVSNPTGQNQRDKASVVALGDTLAARGQLHAAHFCYLAAECEWGCFSNKESKLVLIGSSHHLPFQAFATNEAIQCTEIFEFAQSLDSSNPVLETFQSYKLIYALRLAEFGFASEALRYCEVISQIVSKKPHSYQGDFLSQVYELGLRLKYHDLHYQMYEGEVAEMPDPQWLTDLAAVVAAVKQEEAEQLALQTAQQEHHVNNQNYPAQNAYQVSGGTPESYSQTPDSYQYNYGGTEVSQQQQGQGTPEAYQPYAAGGDAMDGGYQQHHVPTYPGVPETSKVESNTSAVQNESAQNAEGVPHGQENASHPENIPMMMAPQQNQYSGYGGNYWPGYPPQDSNASSPYLQTDSAEASHSSLPASPDSGREQHMTTAASVSQPNSLGSYPPYQQAYQPMDQQQQGMSNENNLPPSSSQEPMQTHRSPEEEAYWAEMTGKKKVSNSTSESTSNEKEKSEETQKSKEKKPEAAQEKGSGWLGSLFGFKKSKQAVLPDDKNPSIVWNEEKKRWENKDGDEEVNSPPPPPPKFTMGGSGGPPPLSLARGGPKKSRYVNTEKDASKPPSNGPSPMLPPMPGITPPLPGGPPMMPMPSGAPTPPTFMVPGPVPEGGSVPQQPAPEHQHQQQPQKPLSQVPPTSIPDSSLATSNDGPEGAGGPVPMMAPIGQPQFFNPAQFNPATAPNPTQTRRVGPGKRLYQGKR